MKKEDIVKALVEEAGLGKGQAATILDMVFSTIEEGLIQEGKVAIGGFGIFTAAKRAARQGINPKTLERITIAAHVKPKFSASSLLKEALNK